MFENLESFQPLTMIAGLGVLCWVILRNKRRVRKQIEPLKINKLGHNANAGGEINTFQGTQSLGASPDTLKWQVELHDLGRDIKAELDSKMLAVQSLTQQYDLAAKTLKDLIQECDQSTEKRLAALSPVETVHRLYGRGWQPERIASVVDLSDDEVRDLVAIS